jgi:ubiquinone/menaquinone biosynthesis C-methylase UbiE
VTELKSFDRVAEVYDATRGVPPEAERAIAEGIVAALRDAQKLLEVGIGTGRIAVPLAERGVRVTGIDLSSRMLGVLRGKRDDIDVALAEAGRPPFRAGAFDAALFVHILHLVPDAEAAVRAALGVVRPGGVMISGGDDPGETIRDEADRIIREVVHDATGIEMRGWKPYDEGRAAFERVLAEAGASLEHVTIARWTGHTSAKRMVDRLARRDYSSAWLIPDEALAGIVDAVRPRIEALYGGRDVEVAYPRSFSVTVARLKGGVSAG